MFLLKLLLSIHKYSFEVMFEKKKETIMLIKIKQVLNFRRNHNFFFPFKVHKI